VLTGIVTSSPPWGLRWLRVVSLSLNLGNPRSNSKYLAAALWACQRVYRGFTEGFVRLGSYKNAVFTVNCKLTIIIVPDVSDVTVGGVC